MWESSFTNETCCIVLDLLFQRTVYSITAKGKNESAPRRKHVPYYQHFVVAPKTSPNRDQVEVRVHRRDRRGKKEGIASSISSAGSLPGPSLTGGPTSRVRPLPIQIMLIGGSPRVYVRLLRHQKNGEIKGAHSRERKKMDPNLAGVDKKIRSQRKDGRAMRWAGISKCAIRIIAIME